MNSSSDPQAAFNELWRFSLNFYDRPGIAAALIELQDSAGLDVNLILFALWLGLSGRGRLDKPRLIAAEQAVAAIRANVVMPLRGLRRRLKSIDDADIQRLREKIAALEIDAERAAQDRLVVLAGPLFEGGILECVADAEANLALYLGPETAGKAAAAILAELPRLAEQALDRGPPVRPSV